MKLIYTDENPKLKLLGDLVNSEELQEHFKKHKEILTAERFESQSVSQIADSFFTAHQLSIDLNRNSFSRSDRYDIYPVKDLLTNEYIGMFCLETNMYGVSVSFYAKDIHGELVSNTYFLSEWGVKPNKTTVPDWNSYPFGPYYKELELLEQAVKYGILEKGNNGGIMFFKQNDDIISYEEVSLLESAKDLKKQNKYSSLASAVSKYKEELTYWDSLTSRVADFSSADDLKMIFAESVTYIKDTSRIKYHENFADDLEFNNKFQTFRLRHWDSLCKMIENKLNKLYKWELVNPEQNLLIKQEFLPEFYKFKFVQIKEHIIPEKQKQPNFQIAEATVDFSIIPDNKILNLLNVVYPAGIASNHVKGLDSPDPLKDNSEVYLKLAEHLYNTGDVDVSLSDTHYTDWISAKNALEELLDFSYDALFLDKSDQVEMDFYLVDALNHNKVISKETLVDDWNNDLQLSLYKDETLDEAKERYPFSFWVFDFICDMDYTLVPANQMKHFIQPEKESLDVKIANANQELKNQSKQNSEHNKMVTNEIFTK